MDKIKKKEKEKTVTLYHFLLKKSLIYIIFKFFKWFSSIEIW